MCNLSKTTIDQLEETIDNFLALNQMFTGYDITVETRRREHIKLRHQETQGEIHNLPVLQDAINYGYAGMQSTVKWIRTRVDLPSGSGWTWVYHPDNADVKNYQFSNNTPRPSKIGIRVPSAVMISTMPSVQPAAGFSQVNNPVTKTATNSKTKKVDKFGRLLIKTKHLRDIGLVPGNRCYVGTSINHPGVLVIGNVHNNSITPGMFASYLISRDGDIRLSKGSLSRIGGKNTAYNVEVEHGTSHSVVMVKPA